MARGKRVRYRNSQPRSRRDPWDRQPSSRHREDISMVVRNSKIRQPIIINGYGTLPELELLTLYQRDIALMGAILNVTEEQAGPVDMELTDILLGAFPVVRDYQRERNLNCATPSDTDLTYGLTVDILKLDSRKIHAQYGRLLGDVVDYMQGVCKKVEFYH